MAWPAQAAAAEQLELRAMAATLPELGRLMAELGTARALADLTEAEALRLIYVAVTSTRSHRQRLAAEVTP